MTIFDPECAAMKPSIAGRVQTPPARDGAVSVRVLALVR
jgi:hypothetical protein